MGSRRLTANAATRSQSALPRLTYTYTHRKCEGGPSFELRQLECFSFSLQFFAAPTTQAMLAASCALSERVSEQASCAHDNVLSTPQAH